MAKSKSDTDYSSGGMLGKPGSGDVNVPADPNSGAKRPSDKFNSGIDVTEYRPNSEKKFAKILRDSQSADGLGVFTKGNLRGKKM